jgi:hypothetical protein
MDHIILVIIGLISGYYIYRKLFKSGNGKKLCKSCGMCFSCHMSENNKEQTVTKYE